MAIKHTYIPGKGLAYTNTAFGTYVPSKTGSTKVATATASKAGSSTTDPAAPQLPFSSTSAAQIAGANDSFTTADLGPGGFQNQLTQLDFGYNSPLNPFNQATMLQRAYQQNVGRITNGSPISQYYSGAHQNALNEGNFQFQKASAAATLAYKNARNRILQNRNTASTNRDNTIAVAKATPIDAAVAAAGQGA